MLEPVKLSFISLNFSLIFFFLCYFLGELSFPLLGELIKILFQFTNSSFQSNVHLSNECFEKNFNGYFSFSRLLIDWFSYLQIVASILFLLPFFSPFFMNDNLNHTYFKVLACCFIIWISSCENSSLDCWFCWKTLAALCFFICRLPLLPVSG